MATIRRRGTRWHVQIRRSGQPSITKSFLKKSVAVTWAHQMEQQADTIGIVRHVQKSAGGVTLGDLVRRYRDQVSVTKKGADIERYVLNNFLRHKLCRQPITAITAKEFAKFRDERLKEVKPVTLHRQLSILSNLYVLAKNEWGLPVENPITRLQFKKQAGHRNRRLREGEWEKLRAQVARLKNVLVSPILDVALETGMRRGEILKMQWSHIDWLHSSLIIPTTKNGHARTIPLPDRTIHLLTNLQSPESGPDDLVFPMTGNALRLTWGRICKRAGIKDLRFHDLRHEAISRFFEMGLSVPEVALISGHRDPRMLFRYAHAQVQTVRDKLNSH